MTNELVHSTGNWKEHKYLSKTGTKNNYTYNYGSEYFKQYYQAKKDAGGDVYDAAQAIDELLGDSDASDVNNEFGNITEDYSKIGKLLKTIYDKGSDEDIEKAEYMIAEGLKRYDNDTKAQLYWYIRDAQGVGQDGKDFDPSSAYKSTSKSSSKSKSSTKKSSTSTTSAKSTTDSTTKTAKTTKTTKKSSMSAKKGFTPAQKRKRKAVHQTAEQKRLLSKRVDIDALAHSGIKGQKWGVRRYQNEDRTWTEEGKIRYSKSKGKRLFGHKHEPTHDELIRSTDARQIYKYRNKLTTQELNERYNRLNAERNIKNMRKDPKVIRGAKAVAKALGMTAATAGSIATIVSLYQKWDGGKGKLSTADAAAAGLKEASKMFKHSDNDGVAFLYGVPIDGGDSLSHFGIPKMRWGKRRWQYEDGSLTPEGKIRYGHSSKRASKAKAADAAKERRALKDGIDSIEVYAKWNQVNPSDFEYSEKLRTIRNKDPNKRKLKSNYGDETFVPYDEMVKRFGNASKSESELDPNRRMRNETPAQRSLRYNISGKVSSDGKYSILTTPGGDVFRVRDGGKEAKELAKLRKAYG